MAINYIEKMATLVEESDFLYIEENSKAYKDFFSIGKKMLKQICANHGWQLVSFNKNYFYFSAFIKNVENGKYCYVSTSDIRTRNPLQSILVRTAEHEKDFRGGGNSFANLDFLEHQIGLMLK